MKKLTPIILFVCLILILSGKSFMVNVNANIINQNNNTISSAKSMIVLETTNNTILYNKNENENKR